MLIKEIGIGHSLGNLTYTPTTVLIEVIPDINRSVFVFLG